MNVFLSESIANKYDDFYETATGQVIDSIEKEAIAECLAGIPVQTILELGCGTGHWTEFLTKKGYEVIATDISDAMLSVAKKKNLQNCKLIKADASQLPFEDNSFGIILSIAMLEFTGDIQNVLKEISRILKPHGVLILGCLNANSELGKIKDTDEVFRNAQFFSKKDIDSALAFFGTVEINECVFLNSAFEVLDGTKEHYSAEGAFLAVKVTKRN